MLFSQILRPEWQQSKLVFSGTRLAPAKANPDRLSKVGLADRRGRHTQTDARQRESFTGLFVRIGKVEPEGPIRSGPSFNRSS